MGHRLIEVPGYTFRVWVTNRTEDAAMLWRDYNGRATIVLPRACPPRLGHCDTRRMHDLNPLTPLLSNPKGGFPV